MARLSQIVLKNFKRFKDLSLKLNDDLNIFIGDNETGKSTILQAIDLCVSGSVSRIQKIGIDKLLNKDAVKDFMSSQRRYSDLPRLEVELYLKEEAHQGKPPITGMPLSGTLNSKKEDCTGIRLTIKPNDVFQEEIIDFLKPREGNQGADDAFPYDYYIADFAFFSGHHFNPRNKKIKSLFVDTSTIEANYAFDIYTQELLEGILKARKTRVETLNADYRISRNDFTNEYLSDLKTNDVANLAIGLKQGQSANLENNISVFKDGISLEQRGAGEQTAIKIATALSKGVESELVLIEEPENHLSPSKLRHVIDALANKRPGDRQYFISTHSSKIMACLGLNKVFILSSQTGDGAQPVSLADLKDDTANYFKKYPSLSILDFALSQKTILVEGPSELILMNSFAKNVLGKTLEELNITPFAVMGLSFSRYVEVAEALKMPKLAVITDNDGNHESSRIQKYKKTCGDQIKVYYPNDDSIKTFEYALYESNKTYFDKAKIKSPDDLIADKTGSALMLASLDENLEAPEYIADALRWLSSK